LVSLWPAITIEVRLEMLKKNDFFLHLFRILGQTVLVSEVLAVGCAPFDIVEVVTVWIEDYFSVIVEENTSSIVRQVVAKAILGRVINPFTDPDFTPLI